MEWFRLRPKGHHGYPQPEADFAFCRTLYDSHCPVCGWHGQQISSLSLRKDPGAPHSQVLQVNWLFDIWLLRPEAAADLAAAGLPGLRFRDVLQYPSGSVLGSLVQLEVPDVRSGVRLGSLKRVTCMPNNEEGWSGGALAKKLPGGPPYCGRVKFHPATSLGVDDTAFSGATDILQTEEWFGSGAQAFRETLVSSRFADVIRQRRWRGVTCEPVVLHMDSERAI